MNHGSATIFSAKVFEIEFTTRKAKLTLYALVSVVTIFCVGNEAQNLRSVKEHGWVSPYNYPTTAADFIATNKLQGNVFTIYNWGGYLIWRLGPENKVFCDGRVLDINRALALDKSLTDVSPHDPYWKKLVDQYNIDIVVLPMFEKSSVLIALTQSVRMDKGWELVFARHNTAVFIRALPH